jgi:hypothetical protein
MQSVKDVHVFFYKTVVMLSSLHIALKHVYRIKQYVSVVPDYRLRSQQVSAGGRVVRRALTCRVVPSMKYTNVMWI